MGYALGSWGLAFGPGGHTSVSNGTRVCPSGSKSRRLLRRRSTPKLHGVTMACSCNTTPERCISSIYCLDKFNLLQFGLFGLLRSSKTLYLINIPWLPKLFVSTLSPAGGNFSFSFPPQPILNSVLHTFHIKLLLLLLKSSWQFIGILVQIYYNAVDTFAVCNFAQCTNFSKAISPNVVPFRYLII